MGRDEIWHLLGTPETWGTEEHSEGATIWRYSDIEFYFDNHRLHMIFTEHDALTNGGGTCAIDPWIIRPGLPRHEFESVLKAEKIGYVVLQPAYDTRQRLVLAAANVQFSFTEERDPEWVAEELGLFSWNQQNRP